MEAIHLEKRAGVRSLFLLLLLTGLRCSELLNAKWSDLDMKRRTLHLADTKSGRPRTVPLSEGAAGVLRSLPRIVGRDWLFPSPTGADQPMSKPKKRWAAIRDRARCPDLTIHDLRRTVSDIVVRKTGSVKSAQAALGHAALDTTLRHYTRARDEEAREAVEAVAAEILGRTG